MYHEPESFVLPDFLYSRQHRKYLQSCQGALYQPARHQQIDPETRGKSRLPSVFAQFQRCSAHDEGRLLYDHVRSAFETLTLGEEKLKRSIELGVGHLKLGVSSTLCKYLLLPYLKEFVRQNPHISISISCKSTNETLKLLEENKIDIGLIGRPAALKNIHFDFLEEIEDTFVATHDYLHNLRARGITRHEILSNATLMMLDKNNMTRQYIDSYLLENQIQIHDSIDISDMDLLIDFARIGVGAACVIKNFVRKDLADGSLVEIPLDIPIPKREVGFAYRTNVRPSTSLEEFIGFYQSFRVEG